MSLIDQDAFEGLDAALPVWQRQVFADVRARLEPPSLFPCTFSQNAFRRRLLQFSFVERLDERGLAQSTEDLRDFIEESRKWDGQVNTARPLIVAFSRHLADFGSLKEYHEFGWHVLQRWNDIDPAEWPGDVATDPNQPFWSMCFAGMQLFVNMSAPRHTRRKSRNLGEHFLFIVNPRERFDLVAGDTEEGRKLRRQIRKRVEAYDGYPHSLQLGSFQAGEIEWWQYGIIEENVERTDRCPFHVGIRASTVEAP
ncbi:YqcI/YcgG family protein [Rhizobium sp. NPDC090279]|uniref:YqcI/YcgG family protein n=1 Tax=Rhizobium sp. NPDC090279 TaxID=3364499 RepID=UPI00383B06AA